MTQNRDKTIKIAVVGTGSAGLKHLRALEQIENTYPIAVPKRASRVRELQNSGYETVTCISDAVNMGASKCIVASDNLQHRKDCLEALECGLDVLVEKPMATNTREAIDLNQACLRLNRKIYIGCLLRFSESLQLFARWLPKIGDLHSVLIESRSYLPDWRPDRPYHNSYSAQTQGGGVLLDMIHEIDYAVWLYGCPVNVQAKIKNLGRLGIKSNEIVELAFETPTGCLISINLDYITREPIRGMRALGDNGRLEWNTITGEVTSSIVDNTIEQFKSKQTIADLFLEQAKAFCESDEHYSNPNLVPGYEGLLSLVICESAIRSSEQGKLKVIDHK